MAAKSAKRLMIFPIIVLGLILRTISLDQSLWLDEAINVLATQKFSFLGMITEYAKADFHPPGFFIMLWVWTKFFGIGEAVVRIPSVIFGALTIYVVYLIGQKLHSKTLGLIVALLLAINPLHIFYSQEARMYALATLAASVNVLLFLKLIKGEKLNLIFLILSNFLVLMSDYVAYLIFPAELVVIFITRKIATSSRLTSGLLAMTWVGCLIVAGMLSIWWIPTFLAQLDVGAVASANLPAWRFIVGGFDFKAVPLTLVKFIIGRINYPDKLIYGIILLPIISLFLFLLWRGVKFTKGWDRNLILSWIFIPTVSAFLISLFIPIYSYFRLLFVLPAFIILLALGVISFKTQLRYIFLGAVLLTQLFSTSVYLFNSSYQREDWRGLVAYLKSANNNDLILFESSGTLPPFDYYAKSSLNARGALKDFPAKDKNDVADLENISTNLQELYLVDYLVQISDPNRLVAKRLDQLGYKIVDTKDFPGVGFVYHYVK